MAYIIDEQEMRRAHQAHEAMKKALAKIQPPLNVREALLALQASVVSIIVSSYHQSAEQREEVCEEHCKHVRSGVSNFNESIRQRRQ